MKPLESEEQCNLDNLNTTTLESLDDIICPCPAEFSEKKIEELCNYLKLDFKLSQGVIFINTKIFRWRIHHCDSKVSDIFHENYHNLSYRFHKKKKYNFEFHRQSVDISNIYEAIYYIYDHDKRFFKRKFYLDDAFRKIRKN